VNTPDKDARRFAIFTTVEMLRKGDLGVHDLPFIERAFYELARQDKIIMSPIPEELRMKRIGWDARPLKMHLEPSSYRGDCITPENRKQYEKARRIMFGKKAGIRRRG